MRLCVQVVEKALQRSMSRMQVDSLDCVQFHWWDYGDKRYLDALGHLADLQQEGLIRTFTRCTLIKKLTDLDAVGQIQITSSFLFVCRHLIVVIVKYQ